MSTSKLSKKNYALQLLEKIKKYEYENSAHQHLVIIENEKKHSDKMQKINMQIESMDKYQSENFLYSDSDVLNGYSSYLLKENQAGLTKAEELKDEMAASLSAVVQKNREHQVIKEKLQENNHQLNTQIKYESCI